MKRNVIALGERTLCGDFGRIWSAGNINITDSSLNSLYSAGDVDIKNTSVKKLRCAGDIDAQASSFVNFKAAGDVQFNGFCKADIVVVMGNLTVDLLECRILRNCSKNTKINEMKAIDWHGSFKAETFESLYNFNLNCDYKFKNILSSAKLNCDNEIICENFYSFADISAKSVNAENIFILTTDAINLQNIVGSKITISKIFKPDKIFKSIPKSTKYGELSSKGNIITLSIIEGDNININNTKADFIFGVDVVIGDLCIIKRVEYVSSIHISDKAAVNEVIKV